MQNEKLKDPKSWWRFGHVWLVISGPAIVVVAGFVTLYLAVSTPNEIESDYYHQKGSEPIKNSELTTIKGSLAPAMQGRNRVQTEVAPLSMQPAEGR